MSLIDDLRQDAINKLEITAVTTPPGVIRHDQEFETTFTVRNNSWLTFKDVWLLPWTTKHTSFVNGEPEWINIPVFAPNATREITVRLKAISAEFPAGIHSTDYACLTVWADVDMADLLKEISREYVPTAQIQGGYRQPHVPDQLPRPKVPEKAVAAHKS